MAQSSKNVKHAEVSSFLEVAADGAGTSLAHLNAHMYQAIQI